MSMIEHQLLSKVLDENNLAELNKYNVTATDFHSLHDVYAFIKRYEGDNGAVPDYRTVVAEFEDFEYMANVSDSYKYLAKRLKGATAKRRAVDLLQEEATENFSRMTGNEFAEWLYVEAEKLKDMSKAESYTGENWATSGKKRWERYEESKDPERKSFIPTPYSTLNSYLDGGFWLTDYVLLQAYTNRGKSWIATQIGVHAWSQGKGVIHYSPEHSLEQQEQRNDTIKGHFNNSELKTGKLGNEDTYRNYLSDFTEDNETPYIIKTMEHLPDGLTLGVIESDLNSNPDVNMVIIDGFNLISHEGRDSKRNNMTATSRRLRQMFAKHNVVGLVVHHTPTSAEEDKEDDDTGARVVSPPDIHEYSETIAVIQDAVTVLSFDQHDGLAKIRLAKARTPHVGKEITLHADFNHGYIQEHTPMDDF